MVDDLFHLQTPQSIAMLELFESLEQSIEYSGPAINIYLAGGMAVHLYTGSRTTTDIDAEFSRPIHPQNITATVNDGTGRSLFIDPNFNIMFSLLHEDYQEDAYALGSMFEHFNLHVLSPLDLAVSKLSRFADHDKEDILALANMKYFTASELEKRAEEALACHVGSNKNMLKFNLRDAIAEIDMEHAAPGF